MTAPTAPKIAIIGAGTIGLSFAALHLTQDRTCTVTIFDPRPDLQAYIAEHLPGYLADDAPDAAAGCMQRLSTAPHLAGACAGADVVQEQGPEAAGFKTALWPQVERHAPAHALLWSSTSGLPASEQTAAAAAAGGMRDRGRLVVVHPYNPPHVMPLLEVVPGPETDEAVVRRTVEFWRARGRTPVVVRKECAGFVANRLAFALFREACSLVAQGVVGVEELDAVVQASMGPRWAVAGPFKAYHAGGGAGGLRSFMQKIGGTVQNCWDASEEDVQRNGGLRVGGPWQEDVCRQTDEAYGVVDTAERDRKTKRVLQAVK